MSRILAPSLISLIFSLVIISLSFESFICKPIENEDNSKDKSQQNILFYRINTRVDEIVWLLNQLIDILSEMVSGLELDPTLLQNYHFRQILAHMIRRIDFILEHFETIAGELPPEIKMALQRLDCVRIRLSNYITKKSGQQLDDSICYETGMIGSTKSPVTSAGGEQTNQIMVIITQIVYIIVQIVNRMGPTDGSQNQNKSTMSGEQTTPFNWDQMTQQYSTPGSVTTPDWNDLISQIMDQMGSTATTLVGGGGSAMGGVTQSSVDTTTVDWGELISAVVAQIETQYGTTPSALAQTTTAAPNSKKYKSTTRGSSKSKTRKPVSGKGGQKTTTQSSGQSMDNNSGTTTTTSAPATTQNLSDLMANILGQFG